MIAAPYLPFGLHRMCMAAPGIWRLELGSIRAGAFDLGNSVMDERCGLIEPVDSLRERGFIGPHEQKTGRHGYFCVGAAILADEDQSCCAISHG
jgi:hypothetical protein